MTIERELEPVREHASVGNSPVAKLTEQQKTALIGLLDWYFASIEVDTGARPRQQRTRNELERDAKDSGFSGKHFQSGESYGVDDMTGDSDAPPTAEQHAQRMRGLQHVDASASGSVPPDFVPTSMMNNRPTANGSKTDAAMVKRI